MLTYRCNLHCPYCFANEFVNKSKTDISVDNFIKAVKFITKNKPLHIGLIGGEPTLHSEFKEICEYIVTDENVVDVTLYTNGLLLDKYVEQLLNSKFHMLINCNSPKDIGEENYNHIIRNMDLLINEKGMKDRINLGINLYDTNMDYSFIMEILKRYNYHRLRISVTVPDFSTTGDVDVLQYFREKKEFLMKFFADMDSIQVVPFFDCNKPPHCIWDEDEKKWIEEYLHKYPVSETNLIGYNSQCFPVIDILPNLQAVRCFGMSDFEKVNIIDFECIADVASYFVNKIDSNVYKIAPCGDCKDCYDRKVRHCATGCIGFKEKKIRQCNAYIEQLNS